LKKGKGAVSGFRDAAGVMRLPGDIVDLPASYKGEKWLEPVESEKKVEMVGEMVLPESPFPSSLPVIDC